MLKSNGINKSLFIAISIFTVLLILSYTKIGNKKGDKRVSVETTLLNPNNANKIDYLELRSLDSSIILKNTGENWIVFSDDNSPIPADDEMINNFIFDLSKLRQIYKIADKPSNNNKFGFNDSNYINIRYYLNDGSASELIFGNQDFSLSYKYFMTGKSLTVYQIDNSLNKYLNIKVQNWSDPYLISKSINKKILAEDIQSIKINNSKILNSNNKEFYEITQKLLDLRHGGVCNSQLTINNQSEMKLDIQLGNKNSIQVEIFDPSDNSNDYICRITYFNYIKNSKQTFFSKISIWTYNKIKEIIL